MDDTKTWPENLFPLRHVGSIALDRNVDNFCAESDQIAFGTGVLVDGLDFSYDRHINPTQSHSAASASASSPTPTSDNAPGSL